MIDVYAKHLPYADGHLGDVTADMLRLGAPTIRVIEFNGAYMALEGSHRLAACDHLGLTPLLLLETPDSNSAAEGFWERVAPTLPSYRMNVILMSARIAD